MSKQMLQATATSSSTINRRCGRCCSWTAIVWIYFTVLKMKIIWEEGRFWSHYGQHVLCAAKTGCARWQLLPVEIKKNTYQKFLFSSQRVQYQQTHKQIRLMMCVNLKDNTFAIWMGPRGARDLHFHQITTTPDQFRPDVWKDSWIQFCRRIYLSVWQYDLRARRAF